jgi:hypothetical protein
VTQHGESGEVVNNVRDTSLEIVLDSGATSHMFPDKSLFYQIQEGFSGNVTMGDSQTCPIEGKGLVNIIGESLYIPRLRYGLISLSKLDQQGCSVELSRGTMRVHDKDKHIILTAHLAGNLYHLDARFVRTLRDPGKISANIVGQPGLYEDLDMIDSAIEEIPRKRIRQNFSDAEKEKINQRLYELHHKWGHLSEGRIKLAYKHGLVKGINFTEQEMGAAKLPFCYDCHRGKMKAFPSGDTTNHLWRIFQKVAVDYKGPLPVASIKKYKGFYLYSDYSTHFVWVYFVKRKTEFLTGLKKFINFIHKIGWLNRPKILQGDWDSMHTEASTMKWLDDHGIQLELSAPLKHSQNGQIERDMENLLDRTRTMMSIYDTPLRLWDHAVKYAVDLINMSPTSTQQNKTPYELVFNEVPDIDKLVPFFTPGVFHNPKEVRRGGLGQNSYKATPCRMLGYPDESKINYLIWNLKKRIVMVRADCRFVKKTRPKVAEDFEAVNERVDANDLLDQIEAQFGNEQWELESETETIIPQDNEDEPQMRTRSSTRVQNDGFSDTETVVDDRLDNPQDAELGGEQETSQHQPGLNQRNPHLGKPRHPNSVEELRARRLESRGIIDHRQDADAEEDVWQDVNYWDRPDPDIFTRNGSALLMGELRNIIEDDQIRSWTEDCLNLSLAEPPRTIQQALRAGFPNREEWFKAIRAELQTLQDQETFATADQHGRAMKTKFVFTASLKNDFTIKYKARLVVCGYSQIKGLDYNETFSPTTPIMTIFMLLNIGASKDKAMAIFDVKSAFLLGENDFEQYCVLPSEIMGQNCRVNILKSLYGSETGSKDMVRLTSYLSDRFGF